MRLRRGQVVKIEFLDHVQAGDNPHRYVVYGELTKISPTALVITTWAYADKSLKPDDDNEQRYTIVRAAIVKVTQLKEI